MKRVAALTVFIILVLFAAAGCSAGRDNDRAGRADNGRIKVVTTVFPSYDWTRQIAGNSEDVDIEYLFGNGVDMHSYQPSVSDIAEISDCDIFIYAGGTSSAWVKDALKQAHNPHMKVICMLDSIGSAAKVEERTDGMKEERGEDDEKGTVYDEHVWMSLRNAQTICADIASALEEADPQNVGVYSQNAAAYSRKLDSLDGRYRRMVDSAERRTLLFGDRFPFRYLVDDYGLSYYAAFAGCSAESEADFETIVFLAGKVDELDLPYVMITETGNRNIADTIIKSTKAKNQKILSLDSMQSVTTGDIRNGETYLSDMEMNLKVLKKALN